MALEFVKGWHLLQTLGEGSYGEVRLLVNAATQEAVAAKVVDLSKYPFAESGVEKEIGVHRALNHQNVIKFYGHRRDDNMEYIFLEYAPGGELFDRIEPDVGMSLTDAHKYFSQLIAGVEYLHRKGIVHRDLKPENLLLDELDNVKISDFGMATLFRHSGKERLLRQRCGTVPYMAPEIYANREYRAENVDVWSSGVILVALVAGELPWDKPALDCAAYRDWRDCKTTGVLWSKVDNLVLSLLRKILMPNASKRYTIENITNHQWFKKRYNRVGSPSNSSSPSSSRSDRKRLCASNYDVAVNRFSFASQPINCRHNLQTNSANVTPKKIPSFSQPARPENMFLSTQMPSSTPISSSQNVYQRLVRRMTRFFTNTDAKTTTHTLKRMLEKQNYSFKNCAPGQLIISTIDKRRMPLVFKASVIEMNSHQILVDFRLSRGDGLEFKRHFVTIRNELSDIIVKGPITWPLAFATNTLP